MSVTYSALGVFAALSGSLFGSWLQKPAVLVVIALIVLALALSMFGLYEIQAPHFITDRTGSKAGVLGALTMGLFVGFVAAPCIGPFVLSLLTYVAQQGSAALGFGLFFTLAMGLGLPYLVLGTVSGSLKAMPRSGEWMIAIRKVFGFLLVALAAWFLRPLLPERVFEFAVAIPLIAGGVWFLFFEKSGSSLGWFRGVKVAIGIALLAAAVPFVLPAKKGEAPRLPALLRRRPRRGRRGRQAGRHRLLRGLVPPLQGAREVHLHRRRREAGPRRLGPPQGRPDEERFPGGLRPSDEVEHPGRTDDGLPRPGREGIEGPRRPVREAGGLPLAIPEVSPPGRAARPSPARAQTRFARPSLIASAAFAACRWASFFVAPVPVAESPSS